MTALASALYAGAVTHSRLRPRRHSFTYRVFWLLLDLDEIDTVTRRCRLFSRNRFNVFSFHDRDYGMGEAEPLRTQIERQLGVAGVDCEGGAIRLLTMPRMLGYAFNPLSLYFCFRRDGALGAIVYEVNNTFGQRHSYVAPVVALENGVTRQESAKRFYVSPFLDMDMIYRFRVAPPAERLVVSINGRDAGGAVIATALAARRIEICDAALTRAFFSYPLLTLKVIVGIHWEALRMWRKGLRLHKRPAPPAQSASAAHAIGLRRHE